MGLDVANACFGNFHLNWAGTRWFRNWCEEQGLPDSFIGWVTGDNSGDQCVLGPDTVHTGLARVWCRALEQKHPEFAKLAGELLAMQELDLFGYLHPDPKRGEAHALSAEEWARRAVASWYAILKHGVEHGDTLGYY